MHDREKGWHYKRTYGQLYRDYSCFVNRCDLGSLTPVTVNLRSRERPKQRLGRHNGGSFIKQQIRRVVAKAWLALADTLLYFPCFIVRVFVRSSIFQSINYQSCSTIMYKYEGKRIGGRRIKFRTEESQKTDTSVISTFILRPSGSPSLYTLNEKTLNGQGEAKER